MLLLLSMQLCTAHCTHPQPNMTQVWPTFRLPTSTQHSRQHAYRVTGQRVRGHSAAHPLKLQPWWTVP
jgi:hypothetical protein